MDFGFWLSRGPPGTGVPGPPPRQMSRGPPADKSRGVSGRPGACSETMSRGLPGTPRDNRPGAAPGRPVTLHFRIRALSLVFIFYFFPRLLRSFGGPPNAAGGDWHGRWLVFFALCVLRGCTDFTRSMQNIEKIARFLSRLFLEMQSFWRDRPQTRLELKYCLCFFDRFSWILLGSGPAAEVRVCHPDVGKPVHTKVRGCQQPLGTVRLALAARGEHSPGNFAFFVLRLATQQNQLLTVLASSRTQVAPAGVHSRLDFLRVPVRSSFDQQKSMRPRLQVTEGLVVLPAFHACFFVFVSIPACVAV